MRRIAVSAAVLLSTALAGHAAAQDRPAAYVNAEICLAQNADAAVAASSGATDAAEFLLGYLCAGPVGAATKYEVNSGLLASGRGMIEGFTSFLPATSAQMATEMPDFEEMSEEEIDAWFKADAEAAADAAESDVASAAASSVWADAPPEQAADPFAGMSIDPVTGDVITGENPVGPVMVAFLDYMDAAGRSMSGTPPVFLRERAAQLVVERRRR